MSELNEKSVFLTALELVDGCERAAYLKKACGGDSLFRKRIEALLVEHERSGQFLNVPALEQIAAGQDSSESEVTITTQGTGGQSDPIDLSFLEPSDLPDSLGKLGHYEIRELIGRGGCGIVFKAFDTKLERIVAIKVMYPELAMTSPARKRFLREARATAAIRHKNVVSIYAVEEQPLPYLVMEFIDGPTLQQKINAIGPLELIDVLEIGQQAAAGLAAAHAKGLIHRDIKPANILLEGNSNDVKLTDFGLARSADDASITQSGSISGTPLYMSPEQAQGHEMDERSDLFSLGSVLYVMSSGRPPFRAKATLAVLRRVVEDQPRPIQQIIPEVPDWLVSIVEVLLAKEPARRFATADEVATLLGKCQDSLAHHQPIRLPPEILQKSLPKSEITTHHSPKIIRRLAVAGGLAALIVIFVLAWSQRNSHSSGAKPLANEAPDAPTPLLEPAGESPHALATQPVPKLHEIPSSQQAAYTDRSAVLGGAGAWVHDGEEFVQVKTEPATIYFGDPDWTDYDVTVELKTLSTSPRSQGGSLFLRAIDDSNRYAFTPGNYGGRGVDLAYRLNGTFRRDNTYQVRPHKSHRWYHLRAEVRGTSIRVWLDEEFLFQNENSHFPKGRIGLATWNSMVRWRNLKVNAPDGTLLWKGFPDVDSSHVTDLDLITTGTWQPLLRTQEEFDQVLADSPPPSESDDAYATYADGVTELHAQDLYFTDILAQDAIIRAKVHKVEGSWGGFHLRSNKDHIAVYSVSDRQFHVWAHDGMQQTHLSVVELDEPKNGFYELAFATIGKSYSVYIDGKKVLEEEDDRATPFAGIPALHASAADPQSTFQFKDVEVMVLDTQLSEQQQKQLAAMQAACRGGARMNAVINEEYFEYDSTRLPVNVPPAGLSDFDMREMTNLTIDDVDRLQNLPNIHRIFNSPRGADDALLLRLLQTPGINYSPHFDIRESHVTDDFFEHLRDLPNLYGVCFNNTQISSNALKHLLDLKNLGVMAENCPNIDDTACEILASRPRWRWLTLSGTSITDKGLEKLSICTELDSLDVQRCEVSEETINKLSAALPKTTIIWDGGTIDPKSKTSAASDNVDNSQSAATDRSAG